MNENMEEMSISNIPVMSVNETIDQLSGAFSQIIRKGLPMKTLPSVMLWGAPGVGKSQAVRQIASEIEQQTGKKVTVTDVRLLLFNPIDLRGLPVVNEEKTLAVWLKPKILDMDESPEVVNILLLDEISAAPPSVQAAAYQITLDRMVGEHVLPENCIVMAAGNRVTDHSVAYKMPRALANRLMHVEVTASFESWKDWALKNGINGKVIGFLSFRQDYLVKMVTNAEDLAFPTPRSWEMVSQLLNHVDDDVERMYPMISGLIGNGVACEFLNWTKIFRSLPSIEGIFNGEMPEVPKATDTLYALVSSMLEYAREHRTDMAKIANSIRFAQTLPTDYSVLLMNAYVYLEKDYRSKLLMIPEFQKWLCEKGKYLNGIRK